MSNTRWFLYFLRKKVGSTYHYYKVNAAGVYLDAVKKNISDPYGWEKHEFVWKRNEEAKGIMKSQTAPISFTHDGAIIVRDLYIQYLHAADAELYIEYKDTNTLQYFGVFSAKLDFTQYNPVIDSNSNRILYIDVPVMESNLQTILSGNKSNKFVIELGADASYVYMHAVKTRTIYTWVGAETVPMVEASTFVNPPNLAYVESSKEGDHDCLVGKNILASYDASLPIEQKELNIQLFAALRDFSCRIHGKLNFTHESLSGQDNIKFQIWIRQYIGGDFNNVGINEVLGEHSSFTPSGTTITGTITIDKTYSFDKNDTVVLWFTGAREFNAGSGHTFKIEPGWELKLDTEFFLEASLTQAYKPEQIINKLMAKMTDNAYQLKPSTYLRSGTSQIGAYLPAEYWTCGDSLSGLQNASMKVSLNDILKALSSRYPIGYGIEEVNGVEMLVIEHLSYFFRKSEVALTVKSQNVNNARYYPYRDCLASSIKIGYEEDKDDNKFDGKDDPFGAHEYKTEILQVSEAMDFICPYSASMADIEKARDNVNKTRKPDTEPDDKVYILGVDLNYSISTPLPNGTPVTAYGLDRSGTITGVNYPESFYNLMYTPKRNFTRLAEYIKSTLYNSANASQKVTFLSTGKNAKVTTMLRGTTIVENASMNFTVATAKLFKPIFLDFTMPSFSKNYYDAITIGKYGVIRIETPGGDVDVFIMDAGVVTRKQGEYSFVGLLAPDTDESLLKYFDDIVPTTDYEPGLQA